MHEVAFIFHDKKAPFREIERISVMKDHFRAAMLVGDIDDLDYSDCLFILMFTHMRDKQPCKLVKLISAKEMIDNIRWQTQEVAKEFK